MDNFKSLELEEENVITASKCFEVAFVMNTCVCVCASSQAYGWSSTLTTSRSPRNDIQSHEAEEGLSFTYRDIDCRRSHGCPNCQPCRNSFLKRRSSIKMVHSAYDHVRSRGMAICTSLGHSLGNLGRYVEDSICCMSSKYWYLETSNGEVNVLPCSLPEGRRECDFPMHLATRFLYYWYSYGLDLAHTL